MQHSEQRRYAQYARHARRFGMTTDAYIARRQVGEKRCNKCGEWKLLAAFGPVKGTHDGLHQHCQACRTQPAKCPGGCSHSAAEHRAFDAGVLAGRAGQGAEGCPHSGLLGQAWLTGHSVGALDHKEKQGAVAQS